MIIENEINMYVYILVRYLSEHLVDHGVVAVRLARQARGGKALLPEELQRGRRTRCLSRRKDIGSKISTAT